VIPELLVRDLFDGAEEAVAGVVDDDVELAEVLVGTLDGGEHLVAVGDVELEGEHGVAVLFDQIYQCVGVAGGRGDLISAFQGGQYELPAEALGCSSDEPDLAHAAPQIDDAFVTTSKPYA
jgi:hypothetical protein